MLEARRTRAGGGTCGLTPNRRQIAEVWIVWCRVVASCHIRCYCWHTCGVSVTAPVYAHSVTRRWHGLATALLLSLPRGDRMRMFGHFTGHMGMFAHRALVAVCPLCVVSSRTVRIAGNGVKRVRFRRIWRRAAEHWIDA